MEKRSRRRTRDLVTQAASQGLSQNEIGCARISMMARSTNAPCKGRIQMRKTTPSICSHPACNARPVHTVGSTAVLTAPKRDFWSTSKNGHHRTGMVGPFRAMCGRLRIGKDFLHAADLVGAAMCSAFRSGSHDRWP
jgi:hypothetical protein